MRDTAPTLGDRLWLTSREAAESLRRAAALDGKLTTRLKRMREDVSPCRAGLIVEQLELRERARQKFSHAASMFFTRKALEQASDERIAEHKAQRFNGRASAADLCCGIGGDLLALAAVTPTTAIDRDEVCAHYAAANVAAVLPGDQTADVRADDVTMLDLRAFAAWHIDPDRRPRGGRTTRSDLHEPSAETIEGMLKQNPHAAIKLAPAATLPADWNERAELEWISRGRECRQLVAWFGDLATLPGSRRATALGNRAGRFTSIAGGPDGEVPVAGRIGRYLFEPDAAVLAARLSHSVASAFGLEAVAPGIAYWTGDAPVDGDELVSTFEVQEVLPLDLKKLKAALAARDVGRLEIKVRGVGQDPAELRRRLRPGGSQPATLLITRIDGRVTAIIARRVERAE